MQAHFLEKGEALVHLHGDQVRLDRGRDDHRFGAFGMGLVEDLLRAGHDVFGLVYVRDERRFLPDHPQFVSLEGAKHSFTNPDADRLSHAGHGGEKGPDLGYSKVADENSWADMQALFKRVEH